MQAANTAPTRGTPAAATDSLDTRLGQC